MIASYGFAVIVGLIPIYLFYQLTRDKQPGRRTAAYVALGVAVVIELCSAALLVGAILT